MKGSLRNVFRRIVDFVEEFGLIGLEIFFLFVFEITVLGRGLFVLLVHCRFHRFFNIWSSFFFPIQQVVSKLRFE